MVIFLSIVITVVAWFVLSMTIRPMVLKAIELDHKGKAILLDFLPEITLAALWIYLLNS